MAPCDAAPRRAPAQLTLQEREELRGAQLLAALVRHVGVFPGIEQLL